MASSAAWNQGINIGLGAAQHDRARKEMLADEDRQQKASDLIDTRNAILTKLPTLLGPNGEKTPEYDQAYQQLGQTQYDLGQLYHPDKAPGALQRDWHFLLGKMHGIVSPKSTPSPENSTPHLVTQTFEGTEVPGMTAKGSWDLSTRPNIDNGDGTHSSVFSQTVTTDNGAILLLGVGDGHTYPLRQLRNVYISPDGKQQSWFVPGKQPDGWKQAPVSEATSEAFNQYKKTGKDLGKFKDEDSANAYAQILHEDQAKSNGAAPIKPGKVTWGQAQLLKKQAASRQKADQEAMQLAAGIPLSPEQQAMQKLHSDEAVTDAKIDATLKLADKLGLSDSAKDELKQQLVGLKNIVPKPLTGPAGIPYKGPDGLYRQNVTNPDGTVGWRQMPPDWTPQNKAVRGTLLNTKQYGWIQTWVDPYNTSKIVGFQKTTPSRYYQGTTTSGISTDAAGVVTTSSHTTKPTDTAPIDFNPGGAQELPESYNGGDLPISQTGQVSAPQGDETTGIANPPDAGNVSSVLPPTPSGSPNKSPAPAKIPPASVTRPATGNQPKSTSGTPTALKAQIPAPPSPTAQSAVLDTDAQGHVPQNTLGLDGKPMNPAIREAANQLLDGVDIKDISLPQKDKAFAEAVARRYGWGRGPYLPRELKQMQNAKQFLDQALNSKEFMQAIDDGSLRKFQTAMAEKDVSKDGWFNTALHVFATKHLTPEQQKYLTIRQALMGTVSGLSSVVRTGRPTEATINRLAQEIPDVMSSANSQQARDKIAQIQKELDVALRQGVPAPQPKTPNGTPALDNYLKEKNLPPLPPG